jgi:hypothetical protein
MIGPSDGIAAVISTPALDTNLTLTCGQLTNDADNHASAATHLSRIRPASRSRPFLHGRNYDPQMTVF